ncbi:LytR C-terminal domain-containing protein [Nocardioides pyridinolyticus]
MGQGARTAITISVLGLMLVVAAVWGWSAATDPLPQKVDTAICVDRAVPAGDKVFPQDVTVSVYNAGTREGLAGRVMQELTDAGFHEGNSGNAAPTVRVPVVQVWTLEPRNPDVLLVASRLGADVDIQRREPVGFGVTVVVGDGFAEVRDGRKAVVARADATICSPPFN